jgi:hypothetical protein
MALPNIFTQEVVDQLTVRINKLHPITSPLWGKMTASEMLAHCCVSYEMAFENNHAKPNFLLRFILKTLVKSSVVNEVPYKKNSGTAPAFLIKDSRNFEDEKNRLIAYLNKCVSLGESHFNGKESLSFGTLTITDWNNLFYKHLDHHLGQFGV